MLTYETLRKIHKEEKSSNKLQKLPENFFRQVGLYLDKKSKMDKKEEKWELDSAKSTLDDLLEIREKKILTQALYSARSGVPAENMTPVEKEYFQKLVQVVKDFQSAKEEMFHPDQKKLVLVALEKDIPRFVGQDMKEYGPFQKTDVTTVPEESAGILLKKGAAREIKAQKT